MGIATTLAGITPTPTELNAAAANGRDLTAALLEARTKANELIQILKALSNALPNGDPNIASIASIITSLS